MSKFRENMVVGLNVNNEIQKGTIKTLYEDVDVAIVEMVNGEIKKAHFIELIILNDVEPVTENHEPIKEAISDDTITISKVDFLNTIANVITDFNILGSSATDRLLARFGSILTYKLFDENKND